jgi:hypothetical protein
LKVTDKQMNQEPDMWHTLRASMEQLDFFVLPHSLYSFGLRVCGFPTAKA